MTARSLPLVGSRLFAGLLTTRHTYSSKAALAAWPRIMAGQARLLREMATGQPVDDPDTSGSAETTCAPPSPKGGIGEHHTGAGHGRGLLHSFFSVGYTTGANPVAGGRVPPTIKRDATVPDHTVLTRLAYLVPVPACWSGGVYETGTIALATYCETAATAATLEAYIYTDASGGTDGAAVNLSLDASVVGWDSASVTINLDPGRMNMIKIEFKIPTVAAVTVELGAVSISQVSD